MAKTHRDDVDLETPPPVPQNVDPPADPPEPTTEHFKRGEKHLHEIAGEVIRGEWGTGQDRRLRLAKAGYDHVAVQRLVVQRANGIR